MLQKYLLLFISALAFYKANYNEINPFVASEVSNALFQNALETSLAFNVVLSVDVTIPESIVVGKTGSNVVLPCLYSTTVGKKFLIEWKFAPGSTPPSDGRQIYYYSEGQTYKPGSQYDRLSISQNPPTSGTASINLNNIRSSDTGSYVCEVNNPPDFSGTGSGIVKLSVLAPPSTPSCQFNGEAIVGHDITLTCSSSLGNPTPIYSWSFMGSKIPLLPSMMENQRTGSLLVTNLSVANSGSYQCTASNELGQASCELTVSVTNNADAGTIAGAVVGVFLAILLIAAVAVYILCYRKKERKPRKSDYPGNEIREDATSPGMSEKQRTSSRADSYLLHDTVGRHENPVI